MNRAYLALLLAALSWGLALTAADAALDEISATDLLFLETAAGTIVVVAGCWITGRKVAGAWRPAVVLGSLEPGIAYVFANVGLILTSAAVGSMLFALESVFVVTLAAMLLRTRPRRAEVMALTLGVIGTVMVATAQSGGRSSGIGIGIMVLSTLVSAGYVLATKRFASGHEPVALVARQGLASLVVTAPFILGASLNGGSRLGTASVGCILLAGLTGVIGFAIPYTLWTTSLPHVRPGFAAVALNLVPLVGVISATLLGDGGLSAGQWAGGSLILVGLVLLTRAEIAATEPAETPDPVNVPVEIPGPVETAEPAEVLVPVEQAVPTVPIPLLPAQRRPLETAPTIVPLAGVPGQRTMSPLPVPHQAQVMNQEPDAGTPRPSQEPAAGAHRSNQGAGPERRLLRPGRAGQPVPTARQRAAARQRATAR